VLLQALLAHRPAGLTLLQGAQESELDFSLQVTHTWAGGLPWLMGVIQGCDLMDFSLQVTHTWAGGLLYFMGVIQGCDLMDFSLQVTHTWAGGLP